MPSSPFVPLKLTLYSSSGHWSVRMHSIDSSVLCCYFSLAFCKRSDAKWRACHHHHQQQPQQQQIINETVPVYIVKVYSVLWLMICCWPFAISAVAISFHRTGTAALFWMLAEILYWKLYKKSDWPWMMRSLARWPHRTPNG